LASWKKRFFWVYTGADKTGLSSETWLSAVVSQATNSSDKGRPASYPFTSLLTDVTL
jgi:hypothetical protein